MGGQGPAHLVSCGCAVNTSQMRLSSWSPDSLPCSRLPEGRNMSGVGLPAILVSLLVTCPPSRNQMAPPHVQLGAQRPRPQLDAKNARLAQSEHQLPPINKGWLKTYPCSSFGFTLLFFPASPPFTKDILHLLLHSLQ